MKTPTPKKKYAHPFKEPARTDSYRSDKKSKGPSQCPQCKAVQIKGRWNPIKKATFTQAVGLISNRLLCPACQQFNDRYALGVIELSGTEFQSKKQEVLGNLKNVELIARQRNDQHRILWVLDSPDKTKVYVTLPELARSMGRSLEKSFHGKTLYARSTEEPFLRVRWRSDIAHFKHRPGSPLPKAALKSTLSHSVSTSSLRQGKSRSFRKRGNPSER